MRSRKALRLGVVIAASICAGGAYAEDLKLRESFGWMAVGKAFSLEQGHVYWVGEFTGTFFNDEGPGGPVDRAGVKCPAWNDLNFVTKRASPKAYAS